MQNVQECRQQLEATLLAVREAFASASDPASSLELKQIEDELVQTLNNLEGQDSEGTGWTGGRGGESDAVEKREEKGNYEKGNEGRANGNSRKKARTMHPESRYAKARPDFEDLASRHSSLSQYLIKNRTSSSSQLDFTNPQACKELTRIMLLEDFGINWNIPDGHLVPPVPNRLNYILWLQDLMALTQKGHGTAKKVRGLDVGCGASLIYPILGSKLFGWSFLGVDVTQEALDAAQQIIDSNPELAPLITLRLIKLTPKQQEHLLNKDVKGTGAESNGASRGILTQCFTDPVTHGCAFSFSMCNPPFFETIEEAGLNPSTAFGGTEVEMVYPDGGEFGFVSQMVEDSLLLKDKIYWFTTMVGKKKTLKKVRKLLYDIEDISALRTTEFVQGQTSRWGIAWSFMADPVEAARPLRRHTDSKLG